MNYFAVVLAVAVLSFWNVFHVAGEATKGTCVTQWQGCTNGESCCAGLSCYAEHQWYSQCRSTGTRFPVSHGIAPI